MGDMINIFRNDLYINNEIPPLLLLPYLHDKVEQVFLYFRIFNTRFLVQRIVKVVIL